MLWCNLTLLLQIRSRPVAFWYSDGIISCDLIQRLANIKKEPIVYISARKSHNQLLVVKYLCFLALQKPLLVRFVCPASFHLMYYVIWRLHPWVRKTKKPRNLCEDQKTYAFPHPHPPPLPHPFKNTFFFNFESGIKPYSSKMFQKNVSKMAR